MHATIYVQFTKQMQNFETFEDIFRFFVTSKLENDYVETIDQQIHLNTASDKIKKLIGDVHIFHTMRQQLCGKIFEHFNNHPLLHQLINTTSVEQYNSTPQDSRCVLSKQVMSQNQGTTLIIGVKKNHVVTIHKRFKRLLYNFWYLVHFTDEIMKDIRTWLEYQRWWRRGNCKNVIERIIVHQDRIFAKKAYVKLKGINTYIQHEMVSIPINNNTYNIE